MTSPSTTATETTPLDPTPERPRSRRTLVGVAVASCLITAAVVVPVSVFAADAFSDVPSSHPFYDEITWLAGTGITTGYSDGTYRPSDPVSRGSMAAFLQRDYDLQNGDDLFAVSENLAGYSESSTFVNAGVPFGEADPVVVDVPDGTTAMLEITVSGDFACTESDLEPDSDTCEVRVTIDGDAGWAGSRVLLFAAEPGYMGPSTLTFTTEAGLPPGPHAVRFQHRAVNADAEGDSMFYFEQTQINVTAHLL